MTRTLDVLNHLIERTELRFLDRIDRLQDLVSRGECTTEAMRVTVIFERALIRLIDERYLLMPSEPMA